MIAGTNKTKPHYRQLNHQTEFKPNKHQTEFKPNKYNQQNKNKKKQNKHNHQLIAGTNQTQKKKKN